MDRNSLIGITLMMALLIGYFYFSKPSDAQLKRDQEIRDSIALVTKQQNEIVEKDTTKEAITAIDSATAATAASQAIVENIQKGKFGLNIGSEEITTLKNKEFTINFSSKGGRVAQVQLNEYNRSDSSDLILFSPNQSKWNYEFIADGQIVNTGDLNWTLKEKTNNSLTYYLYYDSTSYLKQTYTLTNDSFLVHYDLDLINLNNKISPARSQVTLHWDLDVPLQEKDVEAEKQKSTIYYKIIFHTLGIAMAAIQQFLIL